jgi:hypothetical protein
MGLSGSEYAIAKLEAGGDSQSSNEREEPTSKGAAAAAGRGAARPEIWRAA